MPEILPDNLYKIMKAGEKSTVELKTAKNTLPSSLFESICGMLNRNGGHIFLGVDDSKTPVGVYKDSIADMKKNFANLCNNPDKIFPTVYLEMKEYEIDSKHILYIYV